jgi:hypothetical protein
LRHDGTLLYPARVVAQRSQFKSFRVLLASTALWGYVDQRDVGQLGRHFDGEISGSLGCWALDGGCAMENSYKLKKAGVTARMANHPMGTLLGGLSVAALCGFLGSVHGPVAAGVMAGLGAIVGAPLGAMLAASNNQEP